MNLLLGIYPKSIELMAGIWNRLKKQKHGWLIESSDGCAKWILILAYQTSNLQMYRIPRSLDTRTNIPLMPVEIPGTQHANGSY